MRTYALLTAATLLLVAPLAHATDLTKIERKIAKEPAYQTKTQHYCLLVFGLEAKTHVWLVQDGDTLYVDTKGNGDLTGKDSRFQSTKLNNDGQVFEIGDLTIDGLKHSGLTVIRVKSSRESTGNDQQWERIKTSNPEPWIWHVFITAERGLDDQRNLPKSIAHVINGDGAGNLLFADRPEKAPIIHLNGQFTLGLQDWRHKLSAGAKSLLQIGVGPQGLGPGTFAFVLYPNTIPDDVYPEAEITFPMKDGEEPITRKYTLKERC